MRTSQKTRAWALLVAIVLGAHYTQAEGRLYGDAFVAMANAERLVKFQIALRRADGAPIAGAIVTLIAKGAQANGRTDGQGRCDLSTGLATDETRVAVKTTGGPLKNGQFEVDDMVRRVYWIDVPAGADSVKSEIALERAVSVSGRVVARDGDVPHSTVGVMNSANVCRVDKEGRFRIPVLKDAKAELFIVTHGVPVALLSLDNAAADIDFGEVRLALIDGSSSVGIRLDQAEKVDHRIENFGAGVSLISSTASVVLTFVLKDGLAVASNATGALPRVASGTYYITPGLFGNSASLRVLAAVREGRIADLDKAGVPKVTAAPQAEATVTVRVPDALVSINKLPELPALPSAGELAKPKPEK